VIKSWPPQGYRVGYSSILGERGGRKKCMNKRKWRGGKKIKEITEKTKEKQSREDK
jgi:hypothetical protein